MFDGKYGKALTIGLATLIVIVIGTLIFFTVDYIKSSNINSEASDAADKFDGAVNKQENNNKNEETSSSNVELNIQIENIITEGSSNSNTNSTSTYKGFPLVGTIEIPAIELKCPILEEASKDAIEVAVAVNGGPGINRVGNTIIIGHNYRNGTFFSNNKNLANGDKIYITDKEGMKVEYSIFNIYTTTPEDSKYYERDTQGKREVTLVTCTDDTKSRLIICAREN